MVLADKSILKKRFSKNSRSYHSAAVVQQKIVMRFCDLLKQFNTKKLNRILEVGCGTGFLSQRILEENKPAQFFLNDIKNEFYEELDELFSEQETTSYSYLAGDAEQLEFPEQLHAILSTSTIQWFHQPEQFFKKVNYHLEEHGVFAFSTFGENNYQEIRATLDLGLSYFEKKSLEKMLDAEFEILHSEEWQEQLFFHSPREVLKHIKNTGVNGVSNFCWNKSKLNYFENLYTDLFGKQGQVSLTYHPIIIIAKKKSA